MLGSEEKRSFKLGVINGVFNILGETLMDPSLVLVTFLSHLTQSPILLGLVLPIRDGLWALPQLWVSGYLQSKPRKLPLYQAMSTVRIAGWVILFVSISFIQDPTTLLVVFFAGYAIAAIGSGISGLPFMEVVANAIPSHQRGEFFAWRLGLGGLVGIGASFLVRYLLSNQSGLSFPRNFGALSLLYLVTGVISLACFNIIRETPTHNVKPRSSFRNQLKRIPGILKTDPQFRHFLTMQGMITLAGSATAFFAVYFQQKLGAPQSMVGVYLGVYTAANLLSNVVFGRMSSRLGNRKVMVIAAGIGLLMSCLVLTLALLAPVWGLNGMAVAYGLVPIFFFSGVRGTGVGVSSNALLLDISPLSERSLYLGVSNSFVGIILIATALSGLFMTIFGFTALVGLTAFAHLAALVSAIYMGKFAGSPIESLPSPFESE